MPSCAQKSRTAVRSAASSFTTSWKARTLAMKKRSPSGKNTERLSKNRVTARRPPCQWRGTSGPVGKR
jgi:hypothetical protein